MTVRGKGEIQTFLSYIRLNVKDVPESLDVPKLLKDLYGDEVFFDDICGKKGYFVENVFFFKKDDTYFIDIHYGNLEKTIEILKKIAPCVDSDSYSIVINADDSEPWVIYFDNGVIRYGNLKYMIAKLENGDVCSLFVNGAY